MKKFLKIISVMLSVIMLSGVFSACAEKDTTEDNGNENEYQGLIPYNYEDLTVYLDLPDYKNIKVNRSDIEKAIDAEIQNGIISNDLYVAVTGRAAKTGDKVIIDFTGFIGGETFDGGSGTDYPLILGSGQFIPGFEDGVVGMNVGDTKDINVNFPVNYDPEFAGKPAVFSVTLKGISEMPEINDDFAKNYTAFETLAEFRETVGNDMKRSLGWNKLLSVSELKERPDEYLDYYNEYVSYFTNLASQNQMTLADFVSLYGSNFSGYGLYAGITLENFYIMAQSYAVNYTVTDLIIFSVLRAEGVKIGDERYEAAKQTFMTRYSDQTYEDLVNTYGENLVVNSICDVIFSDILEEYITVIEDK